MEHEDFEPGVKQRRSWVSVSVCPSVTSRSSVRMAKHVITQAASDDKLELGFSASGKTLENIHGY